MALKRLVALPRVRRGAQGRGRGREGSGALLLPRAAVISTRSRLYLELNARGAAECTASSGSMSIRGKRRCSRIVEVEVSCEEIQGRCSGDRVEMQGRYRGDLGKSPAAARPYISPISPHISCGSA